jgi:hypothetical protein
MVAIQGAELCPAALETGLSEPNWRSSCLFSLCGPVWDGDSLLVLYRKPAVLLPKETSLLGSVEPLAAVLTTVFWLKEPFGVFSGRVLPVSLGWSCLSL